MIEQFAAHPDRVVLQVRARLAAARRKAIHTRHVLPLRRDCASGIVQDPHLLQLPLGRDVGSGRARPSGGNDIVAGSWDLSSQSRWPTSKVTPTPADLRWLANLAYLRAADLISERTSRSQQRRATPANPGLAREHPKGKGRRGQQESTAEPSS